MIYPAHRHEAGGEIEHERLLGGRHGDRDGVGAEHGPRTAEGMDQRLARRERDADETHRGDGLHIMREHAEMVGIAHGDEADAQIGNVGREPLDRGHGDDGAEPRRTLHLHHRIRPPALRALRLRVNDPALDPFDQSRKAVQAMRRVPLDLCRHQDASLQGRMVTRCAVLFQQAGGERKGCRFGWFRCKFLCWTKWVLSLDTFQAAVCLELVF